MNKKSFVLIVLISVLTKLTAFSQISSDSLKCFTIEQYVKIGKEIAKSQIKDSIIMAQDTALIKCEKKNEYLKKQNENQQELTSIEKKKGNKKGIFAGVGGFVIGFLAALGISI